MNDLISRQAAIEALDAMKICRPLDSDRYVISDCMNKIAALSSVQPDIDKQELTRMITAGIIATNTKDVYSCGMRNGMRWCRGLLEEDAPKFEDASLYAQPETHDKRTETHSCDLISRQAAIDALEKVAELYPWSVPGDRDSYSQYNEAWQDALNRADSEIKALPSAQPEQRWIPCSERLPEVYKDVLICWDFKGNREVLIGNMYSDGTFHGYDDEYLTHNGRKYRKAVAWMPLPEPPKEG